MTLVRTDEIIAEQGFTLAVNVITLEQAEAYLMAAEQMGQGIVLQLSQNTVRFHGAIEPLGRALLEMAQLSSQRIAVHLDHATDPELVRIAASLNFSSVMFDGSELEYKENVGATKSLCAELGGRVWFEAELGEVGGKDGVHAPGARTDPVEAARFVDETGVDGLAVAVGSSHAMLEKSSELDLNLISLLASSVNVPLVLHGSSGVSHTQLGAAIQAGIRKVNIATELNAVFTSAISEGIEAGKGDPRKFLAPAREKLAAHLVGLHQKIK